MQWYYTVEGSKKGPVADDILKSMIKSGEISADEYVWTESMGEQWCRVADVEFLYEALRYSREYERQNKQGLIPNRELRKQAREAMHGKMAPLVIAFLVCTLISQLMSAVPKYGFFLDWLASAPLEVGFALIVLNTARSKYATVMQLLNGFTVFIAAVVAYFLVGIFVAVGFLLLIVPGIIASLAFSMTFFLIADNPIIGPWEAMKDSAAIMRGNKRKLFDLYCSFIGWYAIFIAPSIAGHFFIVNGKTVLGALLMLPLLGLLWVVPYMEMAKAKFYNDIKRTYHIK